MKNFRLLLLGMIVLLSLFLLIPINSLKVNAYESQTQNKWNNYVYLAPMSPLIPTGDNVVNPNASIMNIQLLSTSLQPGDEESRETIFTPDGTSVTAYHLHDYDEEDRDNIQNWIETVQHYTELSGNKIKELPTWRYNCHAFAWYNDDVWIDYAEPFVLDDYTSHPISPDDVRNGDIVTYWEVTYNDNNEIESLDLCLHSAVVEDIESDGTIVCKSKWGSWGLYIHDINYVHRDYHNVEYNSDGTVNYYEIVCFIFRPNDHLINYNTINANRHYIECSVDGCSYYNILHDTTITSISSSSHRLSCNECDYLIYEDHDLYISDVYNDVFTIECRDCTYSISCNCDREYVSDGSSGHYYNCLEGCFSEFESHTYELTGEYNSSGHEIECVYCYYSGYADHDLYMYSAEPEDYVVKCRDCTYTVECWESPEYYGNSDDGHWVDCPCGCYSFFEPHNPGSYINMEEGYHEIECADCGYVYTEDCNYGSAQEGNSSYHYYECTDCGYEHYEYHVFTYSQIENDNHIHSAYCRICRKSYEKLHNWVSASGGYRCTDCNMRTTILPNYSSMSNEDLELLISSLSDEDLEAFLASLPEADLARVAAILPPDDDELVTE